MNCSSTTRGIVWPREPSDAGSDPYRGFCLVYANLVRMRDLGSLRERASPRAGGSRDCFRTRPGGFQVGRGGMLIMKSVLKFVLNFASLSAAALTLAGCGPGADLGPVSLEQQQAMFQAAATTSPDIQPGEKIRVTVYGEDRLSGEYEVDPGGYVSLPLAGTIKAAGLSKPQLEQALAKKFRGEYLKNPKVTVDVSTFRPFYILGEVGKPGEYPFKSGLNVMSAIALAGGNTYRASKSNVLIQHAGDTGFHEYPLSPTIPVQPGDLIRLPERYF